MGLMFDSKTNSNITIWIWNYWLVTLASKKENQKLTDVNTTQKAGPLILVFKPIKVNNFAYLFDCMTVARASDWMTVPY